MSKHSEYANALRQIADFVEANPDIATPQSEISCYSMDSKEDAAKVLKSLAPCKKNYYESIFNITREFGPITLRYCFLRNAVCTPRVVGTKVIPATPERIIEATPEHVVEVIEWDCEPILQPREAEAA